MKILTPNEVIDLVQRFVNKHQPKGYRLEVMPGGIRQDDDWWYVTVTPDRSGVRAHEYAEHLTEIEECLQEEEDVKVLLVPTLARD